MKKKIIFLESLLKEGGGHHMDNLIETTLYFKRNNEIQWLLNKDFKNKGLFMPENISINSLVPNNEINFFYCLLSKVKFFFIFSFYFFQNKKLIHFLKALYKNYFILPDYFNLDIYSFFNNQKFGPKDLIIIQSCRPKDVELIFFLSNLFEKMPKIFLRILYPPKKKIIKDFYYYTKQLIKKRYQLKIFTEVSSVKKYIKDRLNYEVTNFTQIYTFYTRKNPETFTLGFLGETRNDKGFNKLPEFIKILSEKSINFNFIIQFSKKIYPDTENTKNEILNIAKTNPKIKILDGYIDFWDYRNYLQKINIMPLLYDADKLNFVGSGLFYSCITHEIPIIIPRNAHLLKEYLNYRSYEEANSTKEYAYSVLKIMNNYKFYLNECKKFSNSYKKDINNDPLVLEIEKV